MPLSPDVRRHRFGERDTETSGEREEEETSRPRPDRPDEAMRFRLRSLVDENGVIPADGLARARAHVQGMRRQGALAANQPVAGISRGAWTWKGPGNIGGRTRALAFSPTAPATIFAATVGGGIWKTTNGGASWAPVDDFLANLAVTTIVFKPGEPATLLAGTGEGFFNFDAIRGAGIFRSTDGGTTWAQLPSTANVNYSFVNRLAFSADGSIALAATGSGVFRSVDGGATWSATPVPFNPAIFPGQNPVFTDVKFLPGSSTLAVASGYRGSAYFSSDGGASFSVAGGITGSSALGPEFTRVELAVSPSAPGNVYAVADVSNGQLWKSTNNGVSYTLVRTTAHLSGQGWYNNTIWIAPNNDSVIVIGGLDLHRSVNGGATAFTRISTWQFAPASAHADNHFIVGDPNYDGTTNTRVYVANDGGVYKTENILTVTSAPNGGFTFLNNNFGVTQFYGAAGHAGTGRITGGTQDNGDLFLATGGSTQSWVDLAGGDGGFAAYDPTDANIFYGEYVFLQIHRNTTGGAGVSEDIWGVNFDVTACKPPPYRITDACLGDANFIAPFILDPNDPNTLLAGGLSLWRTNDARAPLTDETGPAWAEIKTRVFSGGAPQTISAVAGARGAPAIIYVGYEHGDIWRTTTGTAAVPTWTKVDPAAMPARPVERLAIDPNDANIVYAAFGGFTSNNFWRSIDGGTTWNLAIGAAGSALPAAPVRAIAVHPANPGWVYAGTEVGLFASTDGGATWGLPHDGPANVSVDDLAFMGNTLIAATHGRGIYTTSTAATVVSRIAIDAPANGSTIARPFTVQGWAINPGATSGTGVDTVHVYAFPAAGGAPIFLGVPGYGQARSDIGARFGSQFTNSGWVLADAGGSLPTGGYTIVAFAHNAMTGAFDVAASASVTIATPASQPFIALDTPAEGQLVTSAFEVGGWALDAGAPSGTGVDEVHFYVFPDNGAAPGVFIGVGSYGSARPDVGAIFGSRFTNSGFHFTITGVGPGDYLLGVFARSTVTGAFTVVRTVHFTVNANALMSIDVPAAEGTIPSPAFDVAGWSIDRRIEGVAPEGTGVDTLHVYAYPNPGSGAPPIFLGVATTGISRPDVAAIYGARYGQSGYTLNVSRASAGLAPGVYDIVVHSHSSATGTFNNVALVRVTLQ